MTGTTITRISVYRSGCIIERSAKLMLNSGPQTVRLLGPGSGADPASLRLSVPEGVSGSNVQMEYLSQEEQEENLKALRRRREKLARQISELDEQIAIWKENADFSGKENVSLPDMTAFLEQLPVRLEGLYEQRDRMAEAQEALEEEWTALCEKNNLPFVSAELYAEQPGEYPIALQYQDLNASWVPSYELHAQEEESGKLLMRLRARISQNTGEDWSQVPLRLFSGNPSISGTIPSLIPMRIRFYEPRPAMPGAVMGARMAMAPSPVAEEPLEDTMVMREAAPKMSQVVTNSGQTIQGDTMTEYELKGSWDIRNGQNILCDIRSDEIPCRYQVAAVPKRSGEAYLSAQVKTADLEEMQQVEAAVYLKGTFAGNVTLLPDMTQETYDLSLGRDETVRIKRTQKKKYTSQQLLKGQKKTEYEYEIAVSSRKPKACRVLIKDQIPLTEEKSIQVEVQDLSGGVLEEKTGLITWSFDLAPEESKLLTLAYSTAWPKDKQITGM